MARYVLVQVDENDRADRLREKLNQVTGLKVIAMFAKPTKFCECEVDSGRSKLGRKFGWWCCPQCGHPKPGAKHYGVRNLLDQVDLPVEYRTVYLGITEPFGTPAELHDQKIIDIKVQMIAENWAKVQRRAKRVRRPRARR